MKITYPILISTSIELLWWIVLCFGGLLHKVCVLQNGHSGCMSLAPRNHTNALEEEAMLKRVSILTHPLLVVYGQRRSRRCTHATAPPP